METTDSLMGLGELALTAAATCVDILSFSVTILFAFLATAYFVGKNLTQFQFVAISILYSLFMWITIFIYYGLSNVALNTYAFLEPHLPGWVQESDPLPFAANLTLAIIMIEFAAWMLSIYFMNHSRRIVTA